MDRGSRDYKTGQLLGITNRGEWDYKSEQFQRLQNKAKGLKSGQGLQNGGKITNQCRTHVLALAKLHK